MLNEFIGKRKNAVFMEKMCGPEREACVMPK